VNIFAKKEVKKSSQIGNNCENNIIKFHLLLNNRIFIVKKKEYKIVHKGTLN
jgi:hypothetical protein